MWWHFHTSALAPLQSALATQATQIQELGARVDGLQLAAERAATQLAHATSVIETLNADLCRAIARSAQQPPVGEDYADWPPELLAQIDWARWGRKPPSS